MQMPFITKAWKWLLSHLVIAAALSYVGVLLLGLLGPGVPKVLFNGLTMGIRHVGTPLVQSGMRIGIDQGVMIFFCNLVAALLIVALVYWVRLLNPDCSGRPWHGLRHRLQRDRSANLLQKIPPFADIASPQLRLTSFLLLGAPLIAALTLGVLAGALLGTAHLLSASPLIALAYILPHGLPELAALLLACSIPVSIWMQIRLAEGQNSGPTVFGFIERAIASPQFQQDLKMIINLLLIAGLTEAHLTGRIVALVTGS